VSDAPHTKERAAVDDGQSALDRLLERLAEVVHPSRPNPERAPRRTWPTSATGRPIIT
jgi:hypothetical protein